MTHTGVLKRSPSEDLQRLDGQPLDDLTITVRNMHRPRGREAECRYFELYVINSTGVLSEDAVVNGLYSSGRPSILLKSYFDVNFNYKPGFKTPSKELKEIDLSEDNRDNQLFNYLSNTVEPGGKIIVSVYSESHLHLLDEAFRYLNSGFPPETTYIGYLLYRCGCGSFFKNWLLREGGREGPPALQGEKAIDETHRIIGLKESVTRLTKFLDTITTESGSRNAKIRSLSILQDIQMKNIFSGKIDESTLNIE